MDIKNFDASMVREGMTTNPHECEHVVFFKPRKEINKRYVYRNKKNSPYKSKCSQITYNFI